MRLNKCQIASITISAICLIGAVVLLVGNYHIKLVKNEVDKQMTVDLNSPQYDSWINPPPPIYMQYWMFNLTNPIEFLKGAKAKLSQVGPFTYQLLQPKFNVRFYSNDTVAYRNNHTLVFKDGTANPADVNITTVNIPLLILTQYVDKFIHNKEIRDLVKKFIEYSTSEKFIITHTAEEILFGYHDPFFSLAHLIPGLNVPAKFGLFYGYNNTDDGVYLIHTGKSDINNANSLVKWDYSTHLDYWSDKYGNMLNGTDGTFFHPGMVEGDPINTFSTDICRSLPLDYELKSSVKGIRSYRYHTTEMAFANATVNPNNAAFCVPAGNCMGSGVLNISVCKQDAPIIISSPHFYLADEKYVNGVEGMHPSKDQHETTIDVEPSTGVVVKAQKRLQVNITFY